VLGFNRGEIMQLYEIKNEQVQGDSLRPIDLSKGLYQETWLQQLIDHHPEILPITELNETFGLPISLGREVDGIDNLLITDQGKLILVETKLWRNPEGHRTVVGQILEYASRLAGWDFKTLSEKVRNRHPQSLSIHEITREACENLEYDELEFESRIQQSLKTGEFLLLIVGEKIHPTATQLADLIQSKPHLEFKLSFVELLCFHQNKDDDWPLIVVPRVVSKSNEITRSVVKILYEEKRPEVVVREAQEEGQSRKGKTNLDSFLLAISSDLEQHLEILRGFIENLNLNEVTIHWGTSSFSLKLPWKGKLQTIFEAYPNAAKIFNEKHLKITGFPEEAYKAYRSMIMEVPELNQVTMSGKVFTPYSNTSPEALKQLLEATLLFIDEVLKLSNELN
jgi:hypothetical protein